MDENFKMLAMTLAESLTDNEKQAEILANWILQNPDYSPVDLAMKVREIKG